MNKKKFKIFSSIFIVLTLISSISLVYNIYLLGPIEKNLRIIFIAIIGLITLGLIINYYNLRFSSSLKKRKPILYFTFSSLYIIIAIAISVIIAYFYGSISNVNRDTVTYTTVVVTLNNDEIKDLKDLKEMKLGIIDDEDSPDGYIISQEIIKDNKLKDNNELVTYESYAEMVSALYDEEIEALFISKNYISMFINIEGYENIDTETKVIYEKSMKLANADNLSSSSVNIAKDPFTVLIMGVDSTLGNLQTNSAFNGDALLLLTFNPHTLNSTIVSIPRDSYVPIACFKNKIENKITHAGPYGAPCMINTLQDLTGIDINYYVKVNFTALVDLVDAIDGVEVDVEYSFCEQNSKRKFGNSTVYVEEGLQTLTGEQALAYSRNRKTWPYCAAKWNKGERSDFIRATHQQVVIEAILTKLKDVKSIDTLTSLMNLLSNNVDTNMQTDEILSFYEIAKSINRKEQLNGNAINFEKLVIKTSGQYIYDEGMRRVLSNQIIVKDSLNEVTNAMKENLGLKKVELIKTFSYTKDENYEKTIIGDTDKTATLYSLFPNFVGKPLSALESWANSNGYKVEVKEIEKTSNDFSNKQILSQSIPQQKRLDLVSNKIITVEIVKKVTATVDDKIDCTNDENNINCLIPDFENKKRIDVLNWWNKIKGFKIEWIPIDSKDTDKEINTVYEQSIPAGEHVKDHTELQIKVVEEKELE